MKKISLLLIGLVLFGCSSDSDSTPAPAPAVTIPGAPTDLQTQIQNSTTIILTWSQPSVAGGVSAATGYNVFVSTNDGVFEPASPATTTETTYTFSTATTSNTYKFKVQATNSAGAGGSVSTAIAISTQAGDPSVDLQSAAEGVSGLSSRKPEVKDTSIKIGGTITDTGGRSVEYGIVYSKTVTGVDLVPTSTNPLVLKTPAVTRATTGNFTIEITGLEKWAGYNYRIFVRTANDAGAEYFYSLEDKFYTGAFTVKGGKKWCTSNVDLTKNANGDLIQPIVGNTAIAVSTNFLASNPNTAILCAYPDASNVTNVSKYGYLYNRKALQMLAPEGFSVPSAADWDALNTDIDNDTPTGNVGTKMKALGEWAEFNLDVLPETNTSGFTALPGGYLSTSLGLSSLTKGIHFWSSDSTVNGIFWDVNFMYLNNNSNEFAGPNCGAYVRFIKENN